MVKRAAGALLLSLELEPGAGRSVGTQLYIALRDLILSGNLAAGERLPATRTLARELGISRTTVVVAYERLNAEDLTESRVGAGTFVSRVLDGNRSAPEVPSIGGTAVGVPRPPRLSRAIAEASELIRERLPHEPRCFTTALPDFNAFPMALWARLTAKHWRGPRENVMGYGDPLGYLPLRRAIASHLRTARNIACETEQVVVLCGAQQAFDLIGSVLLDPGDRVWFENPGAIGARNSLIAGGATLVPLPVDDDGIVVAHGLRQAPDFRLAFVTPMHQQPLGVTMSLERRLALLRAAEAAGAVVIEDDYDGEFHYGKRPLPTLKSIDTSGVVLYVGTFSKTMFPALRLGFLVLPPSLVDLFANVVSAFLQGVPANLQVVLADFIDQGHFATHIRRMRRIYAERHQALQAAAETRLGGLLDVVPTDSGLHTIGRLPSGLCERAVSHAAAERRVTAAPIGRFAVGPISTRGLVLGFSGTTPEQIVAGVETLGEVLEEQSPLPGSVPSGASPAPIATGGRVVQGRTSFSARRGGPAPERAGRRAAGVPESAGLEVGASPPSRANGR